tara:strand:- start:207 stop:551 length:345 start_codon:yes stop_codon:yes gene_type:complete
MINAITPQITPIIQKPELAAIQHIENLERIRKRSAEEQRHIDAACYYRMSQNRNYHKQAMLVDLVFLKRTKKKKTLAYGDTNNAGALIQGECVVDIKQRSRETTRESVVRQKYL